MDKEKGSIHLINSVPIIEKTSDDILKECEGKFESVVVFGYTEDSDIKCYSDVGNLAFVNLMVDQLKQKLVDYDLDNLDNE